MGRGCQPRVNGCSGTWRWGRWRRHVGPGSRRRSERAGERAESETGRPREMSARRALIEGALGRCGIGLSVGEEGSGVAGRTRGAGPRKEAALTAGLKRVGAGLACWAGFRVWFYFPFLFLTPFPISKTNQTHLNSNWNLNSNHAQSIKSMHQHECTNMLTLK